MDNVFYATVAGINFRVNSSEECGPILGYIQRTITDMDPEAIGVYNSEGKLLGFIPVKRRDELIEFLGGSFEKELQLCFSGNIKSVFKPGGNFYVGNIAIPNPSKEEEELKDILEFHLKNDFDLYGGTKVNFKER